MTFTPDTVAALKAPLNRSAVKQRAQAGRQLSYIESWHAIAEANRIFGFDGWNSHTRLKKLFDAYKDAKDKWRVGYMAKVTVMVKDGSDWIAREGVGYGSGIDNDVGQAHESAIKEAESDARKRALMTFGNPFGLALYDKEQSNVVDDDAPPPPPPPEIGREKKPAGISALRKDNSKACEDINACTEKDQLLAMLNQDKFKAFAFKVCLEFPTEWIGHEDNSGLSGVLAQKGGQLGCQNETDNWIHRMERARDAKLKPQQQAAE